MLVLLTQFQAARLTTLAVAEVELTIQPTDLVVVALAAVEQRVQAEEKMPVQMERQTPAGAEAELLPTTPTHTKAETAVLAL